MAISKSGVAQIRMGQSHGKAGGERISIAIFMSHDLTFFFVKKDLCFSLVRPASTMKMWKPRSLSARDLPPNRPCRYYSFPSSQHQHVYFPHGPYTFILYELQLPGNLQQRSESIREANQERPPRSSTRITAPGVRLPCFDPCGASRTSG